jgi:hypothetical protein
MRYPRVHQLGFVVDNMQKAMEEYGQIYHIKKWYRAGRTPDDDMYYMGEKIKDEGFDLIIGYCGVTEIELITTKAKKSLYANFLHEQGPGLHHISFFCTNLKKCLNEYRKLGFEVVQNGYLQGKTIRTEYAYLVKPGEKYSRIVEFSASKMFGIIPIIRSRWNVWMGLLTGDAERIK